MLNFSSRIHICTLVDTFCNFLAYFAVFPIIMRLIHWEQIGMAFGHLLFKRRDEKLTKVKRSIACSILKT